MAAIYSNGGNRWNILGVNFTIRDALSGVYKISIWLFQYAAPLYEKLFIKKFVFGLG
jgi:hypothetical protein